MTLRIDPGFEALIPWVEQHCSGRVVACQRQGERRSGGRPAFFIDIERAGGTLRTYARMSRGSGAQSPVFTLAREHAVLEKLHAAGIAVPEPLGHCPEPEGILLARLAGFDDYSTIDDSAQRDAIDRAFVGEIAKLHALDAEPFVACGLTLPTNEREYALADLAVWEAGYDRGARRPVPLVRFTRQWLHRNVPQAPDRPSLVQGDTGPGQFMFEGSQLTGIVDWEFAHIADPMLDLAQIRVRDYYNPGADIPKWLAYYEEATGIPIDIAKLRYYTVKAMAITPLALAAIVQRMHPRTDHAEWFAQDVSYKRGTIEAVAEAIGEPLEAYTPPAPAPGERAAIFELLEENLQTELQPAFDDAYHHYRAGLARRLATYARNIEALGPAFEAQELEEQGELLGKRPTNTREGQIALDALIERSGPERDAEFVRYFYRHAVREDALMRGALGAGEDARLQPLA
jgi:aminoglycoside phosphotransferase (APT) family kinase protein